MIPWKQLATAQVPDGGSEMRLMQRGAEFAIKVAGNELMNSRLHGSEDALATLVCARLKGRPAPRLLIGGLGMGFTLRAALDALGPDAALTVAELVPEVVAWNRGVLADVAGRPLDDPRVSVREGDVTALIRAARSAYDAILLDVDNGPEGLTRVANNRLYDLGGLEAAWAALRPGGLLAVWSAAPDRGFTRRLRIVGFAVEEAKVRASGTGGGARHVIWLATRPARRAAKAE